MTQTTPQTLKNAMIAEKFAQIVQGTQPTQPEGALKYNFLVRYRYRNPQSSGYGYTADWDLTIDRIIREVPDCAERIAWAGNTLYAYWIGVDGYEDRAAYEIRFSKF